MLLHIHPDDPQPRNIKTVVDCLKGGGVIIYPTDTIYGLGCDIYNTAAIERICRIKGIEPKKAQFSFVCTDLAHLSDYAKSVSTPIFRLLKAALPGPYTFILEASKQVPKMLKTKKDTVGIRIPDHNITQAIVRELGNPIMSVSLPMDEDVEYYTDPELMHERFAKLVDIVIDGGSGNTISSTVIDCTSGEAQLVREGAGDWENLLG
ncbi:L-threonylcarbamoyladenylate synthase [Polluticoccus soli]|uniref:L-threonylcarbamoyladenylate synthase n=1 Tax=Polluticoccus soli TaxID=3034150 RepID=UPI0023E149C5|nr:L-threonylcarbamoyladenylate synthase [Flavipsychrobacter sp. JY13-12]